MTGIECRSICEGVEFLGVQDPKFKTARMSVHFLLPMREEEASANALLPFLLSRASRAYPDYTKLGQRLAELYGASLNADVDKIGDLQVLSVAASGLADRYALAGEKISESLAELLCGVLFDPPFEDGMFPADGFEQEKRQTIELIETELNDKRVYARQRCEAAMCAGEPYGLGRYGTCEAVAALERPQLTETWRRVLRHSRVQVLVLGNCELAPLYERFRSSFAALERGELFACETKNVESAASVREVRETLDVAQAKLVMGFRTAVCQPQDEVPAMRLAVAMLGGTPSSKLFLNVREKQSLCYYCSASYNSMKGIMLIQSGVEEQNLEKARAEILVQLEAMKRGDFTQEEIEAARLSILNSYRSTSDSLGALSGWYLSQAITGRPQTLEEAAAAIAAVTREELVQAANRITLDTVYSLTGREEKA